MELILSPNPLYKQVQSLCLSKVTTLIGENGSGKSSVLQSIFNQKLSGGEYKKNKVVCFSSGQNEKFSTEFFRYLNKTKLEENNLEFSCFYFDKSWARLLIFLATALKVEGKVRQFLVNSGYITVEAGQDISSVFKIAFRVDAQYVKQTKEALNREAMGEMDTIRQTAFHRTLENFIENCIEKRYDFEEPIKKGLFSIMQKDLNLVSFDTSRFDDGDDGAAKFDPEIGFFIRASYNSNFLDKGASSLCFKDGLELSELSDGEFQLLFLYSILDLCDSDDTIFILDEADSHLHFKNVEKFWDALARIKGVAISTTHLLDSIYCVGVDNIRIVNKGKVHSPAESNELVGRLSQLSNIKNSEFKALTYFEKIVLIDDPNDWIIFKELFKQSKRVFGLSESDFDLAYGYDAIFDKVAVVKVNSGWNTHNCKFASSKLAWVENFTKFCKGLNIRSKYIYLVCDRDNLPIDGIGTEESPLIVQGLKASVDKDFKGEVKVLAWRRREIKHYLLSCSALGECVAVLNNEKFPEAAHLRNGYNSDHLLEKWGDDYRPIVEKNGEPRDEVGLQLSGKLYNNYLASLPSVFVKGILSPFVEELESQPLGFSIQLLLKYIENIPPEEISEDIGEMFNFIFEKK